MGVDANIYDYFGDYFKQFRGQSHRGDITTCPCTDCKRIRGIGDGLKAQTEAARFVLFLRWLRWRFRKERNKRMGKR